MFSSSPQEEEDFAEAAAVVVFAVAALVVAVVVVAAFVPQIEISPSDLNFAVGAAASAELPPAGGRLMGSPDDRLLHDVDDDSKSLEVGRADFGARALDDDDEDPRVALWRRLW